MWAIRVHVTSTSDELATVNALGWYVWTMSRMFLCLRKYTECTMQGKDRITVTLSDNFIPKLKKR